MRRTVIERARKCCEYCRLTCELQIGGFELDHVIPQSRGGPALLDNLALACPHCNQKKLDHIDGIDPESGELVSLFNPRSQNWEDHFEWSFDLPIALVGKTPCGRATVQRLNLNHPEMQRVRSLLAELGFDCRKSDF